MEQKFGEFLKRDSADQRYLSSCQTVESQRQAILLQQIDLSITILTVQLSRHHHDEAPGGKENMPSPGVTFELFLPSITFTRAPAVLVTLGSSLKALSPRHTTQTSTLAEAAESQWRERSSEVPCEIKPDTEELSKSEERKTQSVD